jgi:transposase
MANTTTTKRRRLKIAGLLNPQPQRVQEELFCEHPEFFDADDLLQVRYELLRAHRMERMSVLGLCYRYGISRQSFYNLKDRFREHGSAGLIPEKPGPKGASKLTREVTAFARDELENNSDLSGASLACAIEAKFHVSVHKRTIEKFLRELRSKKNG